MALIVPLLPDTELGPDTLLRPDGLWLDSTWGFTLALSAALIPAEPEPLAEVAIALRTTTISVPERSTSCGETDQEIP